MRFTTCGYLLGETGKSIWRNKTTSFLSCATTAISLFLLGVAFVINLNLNFMFTVVQDQMEIQVYLTSETTLDQGVETTAAIRALPGVSEALYISKEQALRELTEMFQGKASVLKGLGDENPMPASVRVKTESSDGVAELVDEIRNLSVVDDVIYQEEASRRLASLGRASQYVSLIGMIIVGLVAVMVIGNSIRLTIDSRKHEIAIMKLVGATDEFIVGPFLLQGMVLGVLGGLLGAGMVVGLYVWVMDKVMTVLPFIPIAQLTTRTAIDMLGIMLVTGVAVGILGSAMSVRRHLAV